MADVAVGAVVATAGIAGAAMLADRIGYNLYQRTGLNSGGLLDPFLDWWRSLGPEGKALVATAAFAAIVVGGIVLAPEAAAFILAAGASTAVVVIAAGEAHRRLGDDDTAATGAASAAGGVAASPPLDPDDPGRGPDGRRRRRSDEELAGKGLRNSRLKYDRDADKLADRIGGDPQVEFLNDSNGKEFDTVSDTYVAETKPANYGGGSQWRNQAKAVFEWSLRTNRTPYFHFEGPPSRNVLGDIARYEDRYGIKAVLDLIPYGG